jgi:large repetitive protein
MPTETTITGATAGTVFNNDGNIITGEGLIDNLILHNNTGLIEASESSPLIIDTGAHAISNAALLMAGGGTLYLASPVSNSGTLEVNNGTIVADQAVTGGVGLIYGIGEIEFGAASSTAVKFESGSDGMLILDDPTQYTGTISGFSTTQGIDLSGIAPTADLQSFSGGVLTINGGPGEIVHLHFSGSYTLGEFSLTADGDGGSILTDPEVDAAANAASATSVALLGSYMAAAFATAGAGQAIAATAESQQAAAVHLALPHA